MIGVDREADRQAASEWARTALADEQAVILDTETTDLRGYICELAIIRATDGEVLMNILVNPGVPIEPGAQAVHGITNADVADAPTFADIHAELYMQCAGRRVLVYNAEYDAGRLSAEMNRMGKHPAVWRGADWECIMLQYAAWVGDWNDYHGNYRWHKLTGGDHRALGDCRAARQRLQEMAVPD